MTAITTRTLTDTKAGTGTITTSGGSVTVTGSGTSFTTELLTGMQIKSSGGTIIGTVLNVQSNTSLLLVTGATVAVSGDTFSIVSSGITTKSAPLTNVEIDQNFINLNNAVVAGANSSTDNIANTLVKRDPNGGFAAGVITATDFITGSVSHPDTNATQAQMEAGTDTTTRFMSPNSVKQAIDVLAMQTVGLVTKDMSGFEQIAGSTISFNDGTRVFTLNPTGSVTTSQTFTVTAAGGVFYINGVQQQTLTLIKGGTYIFDQSAASNTGHPLRFSVTADGTHTGGTEFTTGVTTSGTPGSAGAYTQIVVPTNQSVTLYYYCANHPGMGGTANIASAFNVWYRGKKSIISSQKTITISATAGNHYIYLDPTTLNLAETTDFDTAVSSIFVASVYMNTEITKALIVGDERHSSSRDTDWHKSQHNNLGAIWRSGGDITYTLNSDTATTLSFSSPILLADEDLVHTISHSGSPSGYYQQTLTGTATMPTLYLNGTTYSEVAISSTPWVAGTATARINPIVNNTGSLADAGEGKYLNYWIVATNDIVRPIKAIMGRVAYNTLSECYNERFVDYGLPFAEFAPMYQISMLTQGAFAGNKVKLLNVKTIYSRKDASSQGFETISHSKVADLANDDHAQYVHNTIARTISANHTFSGNNTFSGTNGFNRVTVTDVGSHIIPMTGSAYDIGSTTAPWRNVYTSDFHLSNEMMEEGNSIDGTKGNWTIQEGSEDLYIVNNKTGKRYKFKLEEV